MGSPVDSVIDSYETRVITVGALMRQTVELLKEFDLEQEAKVMELRDRLAHATCLRRKDFDTLIAEIRTRQRGKEEKVALSLDRFLKEQGELVAWLRKVISDGDITLERFKALSQGILTRQKNAERELSRMLRELHLEHEEMEAGLRRLLQKGDRVRIDDFRALIKAIQLRQGGRRDKVGRMLDELWGVDEEVATQWHKALSSSRA